MNLEWMAWTPVTAGFFITIISIIVAMTVWEVLSPSDFRRGLLPISTTRGDRLFIGILINAYITIGWIGLTEWNLLFALPVYICVIASALRFG
ncbi:MAG: DUF2160 domain-containing protein [Desulfobacteraceae bacterium]|nr:DUF2160 domain-containing protein [Desulfobacteraceae bacterium]